MTAGPRTTGPRLLKLGAVSLALYATIHAARHVPGELAGAASTAGAALAPWWPVPVVLAAVVILGAAITAITSRREVESAVSTSAPASTPAAAPGRAACDYGPACPRCTRTGTVGQTAMDRRAVPEPDPGPAEVAAAVTILAHVKRRKAA